MAAETLTKTWELPPVLLAWRNYLKLTQTAAAEAWGLSRSQLASYEASTSPTVATVARVAAAAGTTPDAFLAGPPGFKGENPSPPPPVSVPAEGLALVPLYRTLPEKGYNHRPGETTAVLAHLVRGENVVQQVVDDSMYPSLIPGDEVLVDTKKTDPLSGEIVVCRYKGETLIRRFRKVARRAVLWADNPHYHGIEVVDVAKLKVYGVVTDLVKRPLDLARKTRVTFQRG